MGQSVLRDRRTPFRSVGRWPPSPPADRKGIGVRSPKPEWRREAPHTHTHTHTPHTPHTLHTHTHTHTHTNTHTHEVKTLRHRHRDWQLTQSYTMHSIYLRHFRPHWAARYPATHH